MEMKKIRLFNILENALRPLIEFVLIKKKSSLRRPDGRCVLSFFLQLKHRSSRTFSRGRARKFKLVPSQTRRIGIRRIGIGIRLSHVLLIPSFTVNRVSRSKILFESFVHDGAGARLLPSAVRQSLKYKNFLFENLPRKYILTCFSYF